MKRGKKSKQERERIIDDFIDIIKLRYAEHCNFIDKKSVTKDLEKFDKWGYSIGEPIKFKIRNLFEWKEETEKVLLNIQNKQAKMKGA